MDLQLAGRTALVTGASQGIGRAIAKGLAAEGVKVAVVARRLELLQTLSDDITARGGIAPALIDADLYPESAPKEIAARALDALGSVDIIINAAGGSRPLPIDAPNDAWYEGMTLNFYRLREVTHAVLPSMIKNGYGRVINITGTREPRNLNAAHTAKAAVHVWSKGLSKIVAENGITVNCIQPGKIRSEQIDKRWPTEEERRKYAAAEIPIGRLGEPEELANLAAFLASPVSGYITGNIIAFDGGIKMFAF